MKKKDKQKVKEDKEALTARSKRGKWEEKERELWKKEKLIEENREGRKE